VSRAHHPRAAAWELYFTATARLTERIEAALKGQAGLSMPEYSVLLMTDRAGGEGGGLLRRRQGTALAELGDRNP